MKTYLFVYRAASRTFLLRFAVTSGASEESGLHGTITPSVKEEVLEQLRSVYPEPEYAVSSMSASDWSAVEANFHGLYYH